MFSTVEQFSNLSRHNVEGMEGLLANFSAVLAEFKRKPHRRFVEQRPAANWPQPHLAQRPQPHLTRQPDGATRHRGERG